MLCYAHLVGNMRVSNTGLLVIKRSWYVVLKLSFILVIGRLTLYTKQKS